MWSPVVNFAAQANVCKHVSVATLGCRFRGDLCSLETKGNLNHSRNGKNIRTLIEVNLYLAREGDRHHRRSDWFFKKRVTVCTLLYDSLSQTLFACFMNHDHLNLCQENKEKYKDVLSITFTTNPLLLFCLQTSDNQRSLACKAKLRFFQMFLVEDLENTLKTHFQPGLRWGRCHHRMMGNWKREIIILDNEDFMAIKFDDKHGNQ